MTEGKISMKLLVDNTKQTVLFAEAEKECVDFLFHILSLPLGSVVGYVSKESMVGSIGSLYGSLESLNTKYIEEGLNKDCLLKPKPSSGSASNVPLLTNYPAPGDLAAKTFYTCNKIVGKHYSGSRHVYISDAAGVNCPECNVFMNQKVPYVVPPGVAMKEKISHGGYVKGLVTYRIMDDLSVQPMSTISSITILNKFSVWDIRGLEERDVTLDINLGVALLKASLTSKTVLTDVFLGKK